LLAVAVAGAVGAACRYVVDFLVAARTAGPLPWGTFVVNVTGALLLGIVTGLVVSGQAPTAVRTVAGAGFCGAYTTFSTLTYESLKLVEDGDYRRAGLNLASVLAGMAAAAAGWALGSL
jgi:CrcB protein